MGESKACRICGVSPEILWDHPELAARCVRVQFRPDDSYHGGRPSKPERGNSRMAALEESGCSRYGVFFERGVGGGAGDFHDASGLGDGGALADHLAELAKFGGANGAGPADVFLAGQHRAVGLATAGYQGPQAAWFCDTHAWVGLKYAGQPAGLAWLSILTTVGLYPRPWIRERGLGADQR